MRTDSRYKIFNYFDLDLNHYHQHQCFLDCKKPFLASETQIIRLERNIEFVLDQVNKCPIVIIRLFLQFQDEFQDREVD